MDNWTKEFIKEIQENRKDYKSMIEFCCDDLILNNYIVSELSNKGFYFDTFAGYDYYYENSNGEILSPEEYEKIEDQEDYEEIYEDVYQYFMIDSAAAERFATYTNELIIYNDDLDLYLLCITHCGTGWDYVPANWKIVED